MKRRFLWPPTAVSLGLLVAASALSAACLHDGGLWGTGGGSSSAQSGTSSTSNSSSSGAPPVCGNSVMEPGEQCDDGNKEVGDGCSPMCLTEHPEVCPGTAISLASGQMVVINGVTGANDNFKGTAGVGNCNSGAWPGSDLIYAVTPSTPGTLTATLAATYTAPCVHIRTQCPGAMQDEIACQGSTTAGSNMVTISVMAGTPYHVAADSWGATRVGSR